MRAMINRRFIVILLLALLLAGCAHTTPCERSTQEYERLRDDGEQVLLFDLLKAHLRVTRDCPLPCGLEK